MPIRSEADIRRQAEINVHRLAEIEIRKQQLEMEYEYGETMENGEDYLPGDGIEDDDEEDDEDDEENRAWWKALIREVVLECLPEFIAAYRQAVNEQP